MWTGWLRKPAETTATTRSFRWAPQSTPWRRLGTREWMSIRFIRHEWQPPGSCRRASLIRVPCKGSAATRPLRWPPRRIDTTPGKCITTTTTIEGDSACRTRSKSSSIKSDPMQSAPGWGGIWSTKRWHTQICQATHKKILNLYFQFIALLSLIWESLCPLSFVSTFFMMNYLL